MKVIRYSFDTDDDNRDTDKQNISDDYFDNDDLKENSKEDIEKELDDGDLDYESKEEIKYHQSPNAVEGDEYDGDGEDNIINKNANGQNEPEVIREKTVKPKRKAKISRKIRLKRAAAVVLGSALCIAASPVFAVDNIVMNDLHYFTKDEVCNQIGLYTGVNGIFYNKLRAKKILEESPYISSVEMSFKFPDTMIVSVSENRIIGYIDYLGSYLYIDRSGKVIDIKKDTEESLPIVEGLKFSSFAINSEIPVENNDAFQAALSVSNAMNKYGVLDEAVSINVSDTENLYAYINNIKVLLGDNSRMEEKIKTMAEAVKEIPEGDRGTLDLKDLNKPIIFKYTT